MNDIKEAIREEIEDVVRKIILESKKEILAEEIRRIVDALVPDLDVMISKKIKDHLLTLSKFIENTLCEKN